MRNYLGNKKNKELYNAQIADDNNIIMFCQHILLVFQVTATQSLYGR